MHKAFTRKSVQGFVRSFHFQKLAFKSIIQELSFQSSLRQLNVYHKSCGGRVATTMHCMNSISIYLWWGCVCVCVCVSHTYIYSLKSAFRFATTHRPQCDGSHSAISLHNRTTKHIMRQEYVGDKSCTRQSPEKKFVDLMKNALLCGCIVVVDVGFNLRFGFVIERIRDYLVAKGNEGIYMWIFGLVLMINFLRIQPFDIYYLIFTILASIICKIQPW